MPTRCRSRDQTTIRAATAAFHNLLAKWRSLQQLKAATEFDGLVEGDNDAEFVFRTSAIAVAIAGLIPLGGRRLAGCGGALAAGPWEKIENGEPGLRVGRRSQRRLRSVMAKLFPKRQYRPADLFGVYRRPQERALARYLFVRDMSAMV